jgi:glyoxylase-like metal-dependent hydrolase (beta-lactamase superfamily II)
MHRDHAGNLDRFPHATVSMAREEYEFCTGQTARKAIPASVFEAEEVAIVQELKRTDRLHLVDHRESLLPGVEVTTVGGHAPGMLITDIASHDGSVVIASDALHFYEQLEHQRPVWFFHNLEDLYRGYQTVRELAKRPKTNIAPGHDPRVMSLFEAVVDGRIVDLTSPTCRAATAG